MAACALAIAIRLGLMQVRLPRSMEKLARMLLNHLKGILNYWRTKVPLDVWRRQWTIKALLRRGRGCRDLNYPLLKANMPRRDGPSSSTGPGYRSPPTSLLFGVLAH